MWRRLAPLPGGRRLFSWILGWMIPYSGTIGARVRLLEPGHCILVLRDRRGVRNHLRSIHAVAITNAGELASGLAMTTALPPGTRAIVTHLATEYVKKGMITAAATTAPDVGATPTSSTPAMRTAPSRHSGRSNLRVGTITAIAG